MANTLTGAYILTATQMSNKTTATIAFGATGRVSDTMLGTVLATLSGAMSNYSRALNAWAGMLTVVKMQVGAGANTLSNGNTGFNIALTYDPIGLNNNGAVTLTWPSQTTGAAFPSLEAYSVGNNSGSGSPALNLQGAAAVNLYVDCTNTGFVGSDTIGTNIELYVSAYFPAGMMMAA